MRTLKVITSDCVGLGIRPFPQRYFQIVRAITQNISTFSNISYTPDYLLNSAQTMFTLTTNAVQGSKTDRDTRDSHRKICNTITVTLMSEIIARAMQASNEDEAVHIVNLSTFTLVKHTHTAEPPVQQVTEVSGFWTGHEGQALVRWKKVSKSPLVMYRIQKCFSNPNENPEWIEAGLTTRRKIILNGLPQLSKVWVRVIAVKGDQQGVPSNPAPVVIG